MAARYEQPGAFRTFFYGVAIVLALLAFVFVTRAMFRKVPAQKINDGGRPERVGALRTNRLEAIAELNSTAALNTNNGIYRLPIQRSMELVAQTKDPAKVRAELSARATKAATPAPTVEPAPSQYE